MALNKRYLFVAGLPRAGSTLLCNILGQNPRFAVTSTSGIMDIVFTIRNIWDNLTEFKATPNEPAKLRVMRATLEAYFADTDRPVVFDKSRGWLAHLEMATAILGERPKVLVPVRDLRDVLASFEKLWRGMSGTSQLSHEAANYIAFQSLEGRCAHWMRNDQPVGLAYVRIGDAINRGWADCLHFVDFDHLTRNPAETIRNVYTFLNEPSFSHNFNHVEQVTFESDAAHGFKDLHSIRTKVEPMTPQWPTVLGSLADRFRGPYLWDQPIPNRATK